MIDNKTKLELDEKDLTKVSAGKDVKTIVEELFPLAAQYPEIIEILNAYEKGDYATLMMLLQKFAMAHPELANIFNN